MGEILGHNNWVALQMMNKSADVVLSVRQAHCGQGKFYHYDDKSNEMAEYAANEVTMDPGKEATIAACGRDSSPSGTYGSLTVNDNSGRKVCKVDWDVPYGALNKCKLNVTEQHGDYVVGVNLKDKPNGLGNGGPGAYVGRVELKFVYTG